MDNQLLLIGWTVLGLLASITSIVVLYHKLSHFQGSWIARIHEVEIEFLEDFTQIDRFELEQTQAGRKLLAMLLQEHPDLLASSLQQTGKAQFTETDLYNPSTVRVLVADSSELNVAGLSNIISNENDMLVVGQAKSIPELFQLIKLQPDALIMGIDWSDDERRGIEAIARIKQNYPEMRIVALTKYLHLVEPASLAGALTLTKGFSKNELFLTVRYALAEKELAVASAITQGVLTEEQIAGHLAIDVPMAEELTINVFTKLGAANFAEAFAIVSKPSLQSYRRHAATG